LGRERSAQVFSNPKTESNPKRKVSAVEKRLDDQSAVTACREKEQRKRNWLCFQIKSPRLDVSSMRNKRCFEKLRTARAPTHEAEGALRTFASSLMHLLAYEQKLIAASLRLMRVSAMKSAV
jgi:hypothetical protein